MSESLRATSMSPRPLTVSAMLESASVRAGTRVIEGDGRMRTMGELIPRVRSLAAALAARDVQVGDRVATLLWNQVEHLEAYLAVPAMGAVLHTLNVRLEPDELAYIIDHAGSEVVVADASLADVLTELLPLVPRVRSVLLVGGDPTGWSAPASTEVVPYEEALASAVPGHEWPDLDENAPAGLCYTSGTTGRPKGVIYSHRSTYLHAMSVCSGNAVAMSARDRALVLVPMFHANAWGWPYAALASGADLVLPGRDLSPAAVLRLLSEHRVTLTGGVPTVWSDVLELVRQSDRTPDFSALRMILCGGSAVPARLRTTYAALGVDVIPAWGMTEVSPLGSVAWPVDPHGDPTPPDSPGRIVFGVEARVVDDDGRALAHDGVAVGEIEVRGPWVASRYHRDEAPESFRDGWLRTGDVGTLDALGHLRLTDRAKDVIKSGGEWISSVALENSLVAIDAVREAAVVAIEDERWGERPLAVITGAVTAENLPEVRAALADDVPRWWLPDAWAVVDEIPRTTVGKLDKRLLRSRIAAGQVPVFDTAGVPRSAGDAPTSSSNDQE